jgi:hypothetical protein
MDAARSMDKQKEPLLLEGITLTANGDAKYGLTQT